MRLEETSFEYRMNTEARMMQLAAVQAIVYIIKLQGKLVYALTDVAVSSIKRSFEVLTNGSSKA